MVEVGNLVLTNLMTSAFLAIPEKLKQPTRMAIVSIQKLETMGVLKLNGIILIINNLGPTQIPTIIQSIGIIPLAFLIHSLQSTILMVYPNLRTLKEGST